jgi:catechol 2,3-dioxygenase-like lactoylglutathione lyase family enzyme
MPINVNGVTTLLQVFDMRKSVAFYCGILGFELTQKHQSEGHLYWAMLTLGGAVVMLNARYEHQDQPAEADPKRAAVHNDAALFFMCDNVDEAYTHLLAKGLKLQPPKIASYGMKQLYLTDPDGYELCFQQPA